MDPHEPIVPEHELQDKLNFYEQLMENRDNVYLQQPESSPKN
jgi:hypothetical protein